MSRNVPKLRFKGFEDEWENYKLGSFSEKITEKNKGFKVKNVISNSAKNGLISQRDFFEKDIANKNNIDGYYIIKNGDFVYNPRKSNEAPYGPINKYKFKDDGVVSPLYFCFRINNKVSNEYLEEYFKSSKWYRYVHMNSDQGARHDRVSIKDSEVMNMKIKLPSLQEQEKIANFLSKVDSIIEKQEKKVEYWNSYKKGMMQKIFSQKIRFKDDNGRDYPEWKEKKLGEICIIVMGQSPSSASYNDDNIGVPLVQGNADIYNKITKPRLYTSEITKICNENDIIMSVRAPVGSIAIADRNCCIGRGVCAIKSKENQSFLYQFLLDKEDKWGKISQGSTFESINSNDIKRLKIMIPNIKEQEKIAEFLLNIDSLVQKETKELEELRILKKGLLQQIFI
ncbi:restriction endonuclease subunit S [Clostridium perfringens]|nr:restriction endonuclease subunit S [Clostridium perfringens]